MVDRTLPRPPPELEALVEASRRGFRSQFGSFDAALSAYALGTSEDGEYLAFQFQRPDGSVHRFTLSAPMLPQFITELAGATDDMNARRIATALVAAETRGQA
ncbi:hypothetical protein [Mesorhizobium sp. RIZ17]|uniref:hypothetical protein n=1 Tax=Mesorhizobium sp. RIZ17 TaxID=3132743 RepID=UPI003DA9DF96